MSNASETTHCLPISAHGNHEGLPPAQENKPLLSRVSLLFLSLVRRHPFLSSIVISVILTGIVAGVANQSYTPDKRYPPLRIPLNEDGASGSLTLVEFRLTMHHRSYLLDMVLASMKPTKIWKSHGRSWDVGRIDYQHIHFRRLGYSKPTRGAALSIEQWIYISIGGYIFDADVRDLPTNNR